MKLIIEIDDKVFEEIKKSNTIKEHLNKVDWSIRNATPLSKGHGRLIDADAYRKDMMDSQEFNFFKILDMQSTIVEADKEDDNG